MYQNAICRRIILVDQERGWLTFGQAALAEAGFVVAVATTAEEAWHQMQTMEFELVLLDLKEAEHESRAVGQLMTAQLGKGYHVVVLSSTNLTSSEMRAVFKMGAYDCVDKQYDQPGLCQLVSEQFAELDRSAPGRPEAWRHE